MSTWKWLAVIAKLLTCWEAAVQGAENWGKRKTVGRREGFMPLPKVLVRKIAQPNRTSTITNRKEFKI